MDQLAQQVAARLEAMGLLMPMDYKFETAQIVTPPKEHWAFNRWLWMLVMEPMTGDEAESFAGSPWPIEECLEAHTWDVVDHISDSTIVPFILEEKN